MIDFTHLGYRMPIRMEDRYIVVAYRGSHIRYRTWGDSTIIRMYGWVGPGSTTKLWFSSRNVER